MWHIVRYKYGAWTLTLNSVLFHFLPFSNDFRGCPAKKLGSVGRLRLLGPVRVNSLKTCKNSDHVR